MAGTDEEWLYHLPAFFDRVRAEGAQRVLDTVQGRFGGVLYHHRGVRVPGHDATFVDREDGTVELVVDGVGDRAGWMRFPLRRQARSPRHVGRSPARAGAPAPVHWVSSQ